METKGNLVTLGLNGVITDPTDIAVTLFENLFLSNYSQSSMYHGTIASMSKWWQESGDDLDTFQSVATEGLTDYYLQYFSNVIITIDTETDGDNSCEITIQYGDGTDLETLSDRVFVDNGIIHKLQRS